MPSGRREAGLSKASATDSSVLVAAKTGAGKELVASPIHKRSQRSSRDLRVSAALRSHAT